MALIKVPVKMQWMTRHDLDRVVEIEFAAYQENSWTREEFVSELRIRNVIGMVAENEAGCVLGFLVYEHQRTRIRLLDFAVDPLCWRYGIGTQMMDALAGKMRADRRTRIVVYTSEHNSDAHLFLRATGFKLYRVRRDYYNNGMSCYAFDRRLAVAVDKPNG